MRKTGSEIEQDLLQMITGSQLAGAINGAVYVDGTRPKNSSKEDIIISFQTGTEEAVQLGDIEINTYIPDTGNTTDGYLKNASRCLVLEKLARALVESIVSVEYSIALATTICSIKVPDVNQHFINVKLKFKRSIN